MHKNLLYYRTESYQRQTSSSGFTSETARADKECLLPLINDKQTNDETCYREPTNTLKRFDASFDDSTTSGQRSVTQPSTTFYGLSQQDNLPPIEMRPTVSFNWYPNCFLSRQCSEVKYCFNRARSTFHRSSKHRGTSIW